MFLILSLVFSVFLSFSFCIFFMFTFFLSFIPYPSSVGKISNNPCFSLPSYLPYNALAILPLFFNTKQKRRFRVSAASLYRYVGSSYPSLWIPEIRPPLNLTDTGSTCLRKKNRWVSSESLLSPEVYRVRNWSEVLTSTPKSIWLRSS